MVGTTDIQDYIEHEDGSATLTFDCDVKTRELLVGLGLASLLEKAVNEPDQLELDL